MDSGPSTPPLLEHTIFPRNSVNLVVGPTHIGKTFFVNKLLNNYKLYFNGPVGRILIVLCNDRVQPLALELAAADEVEVEQIPLSEFVPYNLEANDLVVIDDLQIVTPAIRETITVGAHHYNLVSLFVITHDLVGNANFELVRKCHRLFLFMSANANTRQINHIINYFYHDIEIKKYLKTVASFCQQEREVLALELNPITSSSSSSSQNSQVILALSHIGCLLTKGYYLLYPFPHWGQTYTAQIGANYSVQGIELPPTANMPESTLVAVPVSAVVKAKAAAAAAKTEPKCMDKVQWEETNREIEENIESYFPPQKWQKIKNLAKEILRNKQFCVKTDGKTFHLVNKPKTEVSLIDFLAVATRRAAPMEQERDPTWRVFAMHVDTLLKNNAPKDLFKNKLLMPAKFQF